jgi:hypothetical protein
MHAAVSTFALGSCCLYVLGLGCCAPEAQAQGEREPSSSTPLVQPLWQVELSRPAPLDSTDNRIALTRWSADPVQRGAGWGLGLALPAQSNGRDGHSGIDLGLRWRSAQDGAGQVRAGVWLRAATLPDTPATLAQQISDRPNLDTRLEMQFSSATARGIQFELGGAFGMQLNSNEKVLLRVSSGRPMLYYRAKF